MVGCLSDLYQSIENLDNNYIQPDQHKHTVLKPRVSNATEEASLFMLTNLPYKKHTYVTNTYGKICPGCSLPLYSMNTTVTFVEGNTAAVPVKRKGGFVKGVVTYMVMDDLAFSPTSAVIGLSFLNNYNVDAKSLEEKVVDLDMAKGLKLLKVSFQTKNVLTEVFLKDQDNMEEDRKPCIVA